MERYQALYQDRLNTIRADLLREAAAGEFAFDVEFYTSKFQLIGADSYGRLSGAVLEEERKIRDKNSRAANLLNKYLLIMLLRDFDIHSSSIILSEAVVELYKRELKRIHRQLDTLNSDHYQFSNDSFVKDLAILCHRLIPVGAEFVLPYAGIPRSLLFRGNLGHFFKAIWVCFIRARGFRPYLELHAHILALDDFNPEGWLKTYANLADLLVLNPQFRGAISSSWFLDPALEQISPHLSYLRKVPERYGATVLMNGEDALGTSGALATSRTRRNLFEVGKYRPRIYFRIWPRKSLIFFRSHFVNGDCI